MTIPNYDAVKARIDAIDLEPIKYKLVVEKVANANDLPLLEKWRFLFLALKYRTQPIVVSHAIDSFWHYHILDTRKYAEDCETAFGEFLHHFPYFGLRGEEDQQALRAAYQATLELMRAEFGETPDEELRLLGTNDADPALPSLCSDCSNYSPIGGTPEAWRRPRLADTMM